MKRAVSYELYIIGQVENVKNLSRGNATHWKRQYDSNTGKVVFKKKFGYQTIEEARESAIKLVQDNPWCHNAVNVYKCAHCNKYHIGHESGKTANSVFRVSPFATA